MALYQAALIGCMSRAMYDEYDQALEALDDPAAADEDWKESAMTDAKHEGISKMVDQMIHMTHLGPERKKSPSKVACEAFGGFVGFNDYRYEEMAFEEKDYLNDRIDNMFQYRLFLECREIDSGDRLEASPKGWARLPRLPSLPNQPQLFCGEGDLAGHGGASRSCRVCDPGISLEGRDSVWFERIELLAQNCGWNDT